MKFGLAQNNFGQLHQTHLPASLLPKLEFRPFSLAIAVSMPTKVFFFWGTWQSGTGDNSNRKIPELLWNCAADQWDVKSIGGVGHPDGDRPRRGASLLPWLNNTRTHLADIGRKFLDGAVAYSMERKLLFAWESTLDVEQGQKIIAMGCSRGGFLAQMFIHHVGRHGYNTTLDYPRVTLLNTSTYLYCFDPVGSSGFGPLLRATLINRPTIRNIFKVGTDEYACDVLPEHLKRALVILMKDENRTLYSPTLFCRAQGPDSDTTNLDQIWFNGVHRDAWGPSVLSLNVLAYIVTDLINYGLLNSNGASLVVQLVHQLTLSQSSKGSFFSRRSPRQVDCRVGLKQRIHWSATSSDPSNQLEPDYLLYRNLSQSQAQQS